MSLPRRLGLCVISTLRLGQTTAANAWAFKTEKIPPPCSHFSLFQAVFTLWSLSTNSDTSCKCFHCSTESFLSGSNMWYQFIILNNATRNPLTLKIKWELCNLTLKSPCFFFLGFFKALRLARWGAAGGWWVQVTHWSVFLSVFCSE